MSRARKGKILVLSGLSTGPSVEQKIFHVSLDKKDKIDVKDSTPAYIDIGVQSASCVINNVLYAVGIGSARNELWKWSAERDEWARLADLPSGRFGHCVAGVGEKIYVAGGNDVTDYKVVDCVFCYDINSNNWTQVTPLRHAVYNAACVGYKNFFYVFGGTGKDQNEMDHVQVYDTSKGKVELGPKPLPQAERRIIAVLWGSKALLIGDWNCYIYDIELKTWGERERFKPDLYLFSLSVSEDTLYIAGGSNYVEGENDELVCVHSDEVKSLSVDDFMSDNKQADWKHHAKLPVACCVHFFSSQPLHR